MPELDDLGSLVPLAGADLSALDKIAVYHAATKSVREVSAVEVGSGTTESVLALLANADLEVTSIGLSDGTGTALDPGSLSLNAAGDLVIHDNESNAEDLPHLVDSLESLNYATRVLAASMDNVTFSRKLADIPLPASALTNAKQLHIIGRTFSQWTTGFKPNTGIYYILCKEGQDPKTEGIYYQFAGASTTEAWTFHIALAFSVTTGTWTLANQNTASSGTVIKNSGGTITHAASWAWGGDAGELAPVTGTAGDPVKLELHVMSIDDSDAVTANLFTSGQLSVIHE